MTLLTDAASKPEQDQEADRLPPDQHAGPDQVGQLPELTDEQILRAFPALTKPRKLLQAVRMPNLLSTLLQNLVLAEEVRRTGGDLQQLTEWRRQRWGKRVEQEFVLQRKRFQRTSYYQLALSSRGEAMEYYYQLCNREILFEDLLRQHHPPKAGKPQKGLLHRMSLEALPHDLAKKLRKAQPGVPIQPVVMGKTVLLLQLIERHEPELDQSIREQLEHEIEQQWLQDELRRRLENIEPTETLTKPATSA